MSPQQTQWGIGRPRSGWCWVGMLGRWVGQAGTAWLGEGHGCSSRRATASARERPSTPRAHPARAPWALRIAEPNVLHWPWPLLLLLALLGNPVSLASLHASGSGDCELLFVLDMGVDARSSGWPYLLLPFAQASNVLPGLRGEARGILFWLLERLLAGVALYEPIVARDPRASQPPARGNISALPSVGKGHHASRAPRDSPPPFRVGSPPDLLPVLLWRRFCIFSACNPLFKAFDLSLPSSLTLLPSASADCVLPASPNCFPMP